MSYSIDTVRKEKLVSRFRQVFSGTPESFFSSPGRSELGGNHTDHQGGHVLACAINLDILAAVRKTNTREIRVCSGDAKPFTVRLNNTGKEAPGSAASLVQGVALLIEELGYELCGLDIVCDSLIPVGAGLSSSAAFEVLIGQILNFYCCSNSLHPVQLARIGQQAENEYFGKPCGLMDQMACAYGGVIGIDFGIQVPLINQITADFQDYMLCITNVGSSHENLTDAYRAIPDEMRQVAACFDKQYLSQVEAKLFFESLPDIRKKVPDRAITRAIHYFNEDIRAQQEAEALQDGDLSRFFSLVRQSGHSSATLLQNAYAFETDMSIPIALGMSETFLQDQGVCRVHGGGFAGTIQAWVREKDVSDYISWMQPCGHTYLLQVRDHGAIHIE